MQVFPELLCCFSNGELSHPRGQRSFPEDIRHAGGEPFFVLEVYITQRQWPTCLAALVPHRSALHYITLSSNHHAVITCCITININESKPVGGCEKQRVECRNTKGKEIFPFLPARISVVGGDPLGSCPVYMQIFKKKTISKTFHWRVIAETWRQTWLLQPCTNQE